MDTQRSRHFDPALIARRRTRWWALVGVAALLVLRVGAERTPILRRPDLVLFDAWQSLRATRSPSNQVVIVGIDEKSIARMGPPAWPRREYVPVIERLTKAGAKVIGFDFTFGTVARQADDNAVLADTMRQAGNVVFGYEFTRVGDPSPPQGVLPDAVRVTALRRFKATSVPPAPNLIEPEPVLADAAAAVGHVRAIISEDGRIRQLPLLIQYGNQGYPSLAIEVARLYTGTSSEAIGLKGGVLQMGVWDIPVSPSGEVFLDWPAAGERAFAQYSFLDVVRGDVPDAAFRGKAVLVAGVADGLDDRDFPFAVKAPAVLSYATFLDNLFRFDFVQAPQWAWPLEWALFLVICALSVWLLPRLPTPVLLVGVPLLVIVLVGGTGFLFVQKGIWVRAFYPVLALVVPLAVVVTQRLTASEKERRDLGAEKVENEKLLGLSFQEKGMLDMALAQFNKLAFTDDMKSIYLNLAVDYENRGLPQKAFLVYKKIFDADPTFDDVVHSMERLSQSGAGRSFFAVPSRVTAATGPESPLADVAPPPVVVASSSNEVPTKMSSASQGRGLIQGTMTVSPSAQAKATSVEATSVAPPLSLPHTPTMPAGPAPPGARLGRYVVERHLGRGGMGDVYLVRDTVIDRRAALKTVRLDADLDPTQAIEVRQRFYREAKSAGSLTHPNIVTIYDVAEDLGVSYIVMEYIEGGTLTEWMKRGRFKTDQTKSVICNAALALQHAHEHGVVHRDVKPDNIMLSTNGSVKVMDFGIARAVDSTLTKAGTVMGTPAYMSPEQVTGYTVDARSDIFSLGVILYELLTGRRPFVGDSLPSLMFAIINEEPILPSLVDPNIDTVWDQIVTRALAKRRDERYATAQDFSQSVNDAPER